jgi:Xaa-Pro dipeptidase
MIKKLQKELDVDQAIFINIKKSDGTSNIFYFLQQKIAPAVLVIPKKGKPILYTAGFEYKMYKKQIKDIKVKEMKKLDDALKGLKGTTGYDARELNVKLYNKLRKIKRKDISVTLQNIRKTKTEVEIKKLKKAAAITTDIFNRLLKKKFKHEKEIKQFLLTETAANGCEPAFDPVVASGKDAADPHYNKEKPLAKGFCVIDYGVRYQGYRGDVTRTVFIGKPTEKEREIYNNLLQIQKQAIKLYKKGNKCNDAYQFVANILKERFIHSLGHGVGLDIHESPNIGLSPVIFQNNMVVTCEPGVYVPNKYGIRIEDDILINNDKPIILSKTPKALICWKST